ncbi:hypothetical protein [Aquibacillus sediminis]|uniref:hypothetical protein n=1 Tax=Aquibacillus sediminis TaxID=2574734 RepID=UPI001108A445|nr:hypothetical protein [Aquibacillus sediminis]
MIKVIGVLVASAVVYKLDYPTVKKSKSNRDKFVYWIFFLFVVGIMILYVLEVPFPNPTEWIKQVYKPVGEPYKQLVERIVNQ